MLDVKLEVYNFVNKALDQIGLRLTKSQKGSVNVYERLLHIKRLGFEPKVIFDCGAFVGNWTKRVSKIFPDALFVLIEANSKIIERTEHRLKEISSRTILLNIAIGEKQEEGYLNIWETPSHKIRDSALQGASLLSHVRGEPTSIVPVKIRTIDSIASEYNLVPDLIKLDLQGGELEALKGAKSALRKTELFIIEFGCLDAYLKRATPDDLMQIMYKNGYRLYDIVDLLYRPYDKALVGGDFFFINKKSRLRDHKDYF